MAKKYPKPSLKPRELKKAEASEWYVEAEWPDRPTEQVGQFGSESEAQDWIVHQSAEWFRKRGQ